MNFSSELISGVNGAYYPLQVRLVLETGNLGINNMPLLFYLDALLIKFLQFFGFILTDSLILNTVKFIDSISFVFIAFPVFKLINKVQFKATSVYAIAIIAFSLISFTPLILISDLQKNSLAMVFTMFFILNYYNYIESLKLKHIILTFIFLIFTGLTHFGTFIFAIIFLSINLIYQFRKKAFIPVLVIVTGSLFAIKLFDIKRYDRLLTFWNSIFENPLIFGRFIPPPELLNFIFSYSLAIFTMFLIMKKRNEIPKNIKSILFSSSISLFLLSFPLLDFEYFRRLSILSLLPQLLSIIFMADFITSKAQKIITIVMFIFTGLSIFAVMGKPKSPVISFQEFNDLKKMEKHLITDKSKTLIVARHGLEWWAAWTLKTKIAQDKAFNSNLTNDYKQIVFLLQKQDRSDMNFVPEFHKLKIPPDSKLLYNSNFFTAYEFSK